MWASSSDEENPQFVSKGAGVTRTIGEGVGIVGFSAFSIILSVAFATIFFTLYAVYNDAECEENLQLWHLIMGIVECVLIVFTIVKIIETVCCTVANIPFQVLLGKNSSVFDMIKYAFDTLVSIPQILIVLFSLAWLIVGTVWIARTDPDDANCPDALYQWTLGLIIIAWALRAIFFCLIILIIAVGCLCCCGVMGITTLISTVAMAD